MCSHCETLPMHLTFRATLNRTRQEKVECTYLEKQSFHFFYKPFIKISLEGDTKVFSKQQMVKRI